MRIQSKTKSQRTWGEKKNIEKLWAKLVSFLPGGDKIMCFLGILQGNVDFFTRGACVDVL